MFSSKGWNSQAHRGFPGKFESSNVSRDNVTREIGCIVVCICLTASRRLRKAAPTLDYYDYEYYDYYDDDVDY